MQKARIFLILGIWITILPYLGFPYSWKDILTTLSGLGIIFGSYLLYKESKKEGIGKGKTFDNFRENEFKGGE
ncbi:MAG: hypothetical protein WC694_01425 [Candidatus Paceibacterota bacterium]|jgi:formate hydrogenlyase subunit 3/multisubunit Na+/H+ antiporter MnhD subunit